MRVRPGHCHRRGRWGRSELLVQPDRCHRRMGALRSAGVHATQRCPTVAIDGWARYPTQVLSDCCHRRMGAFHSAGKCAATAARPLPSADGLATVHDRDVLIYCISQLMSSINEGKQVSQVLRFRAHDLLKATNRMTSGQGYEALKAAFERLAGTRISTNVATGGQEVFDNFGLIERVTIVRETRDGRMQEVEVKLSDWVFNAIRHNEVLTLHRTVNLGTHNVTVTNRSSLDNSIPQRW